MFKPQNNLLLKTVLKPKLINHEVSNLNIGVPISETIPYIKINLLQKRTKLTLFSFQLNSFKFFKPRVYNVNNE